jgi:hypothetical protein
VEAFWFEPRWLLNDIHLGFGVELERNWMREDRIHGGICQEFEK